MLELVRLANLYGVSAADFSIENEKAALPLGALMLARKAAPLSKNDLEKVALFIEFLHTRSSAATD